MLFAIKNSLLPTLALLGIFMLAGLRLEKVLGLSWSWDFSLTTLRDLLIGAFVMAASDGALHALLVLFLGEAYLSRYRALVEYFRPQQAPQIVAGGLLAGGEELIFRGVLLEGLRTAGWPGTAAVAASSLVFGALHFIPRGPLWPFALWAVWEGVLLGSVYVITGSLLVVVLLHVAHDIGGFSVFAYQRRHWRPV